MWIRVSPGLIPTLRSSFVSVDCISTNQRLHVLSLLQVRVVVCNFLLSWFPINLEWNKLFCIFMSKTISREVWSIKRYNIICSGSPFSLMLDKILNLIPMPKSLKCSFSSKHKNIVYTPWILLDLQTNNRKKSYLLNCCMNFDLYFLSTLNNISSFPWSKG